MDFVEVEQVDDGNGARVLGEEIQTLRKKLVAGEDGNMSDIKVLYHYDSMRYLSLAKCYLYLYFKSYDRPQKHIARMDSISLNFSEPIVGTPKRSRANFTGS